MSHTPVDLSEKTTASEPTSKFRAKLKTIVNLLDQVIFFLRWLLYPINLGLMLVLIAYIVKFFVEAYFVVVTAHGLSVDQVMVGILGLVDIAMVANLVVMIVQGSHQIFIRPLQIADPRSRPQWLDHIDSGILKVKVSLSMTSITGIGLFRDFFNIEHIAWDAVVHRIYIHVVCMATALVMAVIWRLTHPSYDPNGVHNNSDRNAAP
jgi:uncharacterized protein (TIGR00645 family)